MIDTKTLATLEFNKVVERLAAKTETSLGNEHALALLPSSNYVEVLRRQQLTAEGRILLELQPTISLHATHDVREQVAQARLGHMLQPTELIAIQATLLLAQNTQATVSRLRTRLPLLTNILDQIPSFQAVIAEISRCLNQKAEVVDEASPDLGSLRRRSRQSHDRLTKCLQKVLNSSTGRQATQDSIITLRNGRYVIPIKSEMRSQVDGIVHDTSSSGATLFIEPLEAVGLGNMWHELQLEEEREIQRILRNLSTVTGKDSDRIADTVNILADLDLVLAIARLAEAMGCTELPHRNGDQDWLLPRPGALKLIGARHPLLTDPVIGIDLSVGHANNKNDHANEYIALLITGPNTGGKTVALKTAGLLALMAQAGLAVPASGDSSLPVLDSIHADIGDEQSIEQSLSTFSSHMINITSILKNISGNSLVLLDELGAGTDPSEGSALARAILRYLLRKGCLTIATTHHDSLKAFAHVTPEIMNGCVEFDPKTLAPTYHLSIGLPGQSNAIAIASRLGVDKTILIDARQALSPEHKEIESLIANLRDQRQAAEDDRQAQATALEQTKEDQHRLENMLVELETEKDRLLADTSQQLEAELDQARAQINLSLKEIDLAKPASVEVAQEKLVPAERSAELIASQRNQKPQHQSTLPPITIGDLLWLRDSAGNKLSHPGEALSESANGEIEVLLGALRAKVNLTDIDRVEKMPAEKQIKQTPPVPTTSSEVSVRGMTVEEAFQVIDGYLDSVFLAELPMVRIIHGKGTGTLRRSIRKKLSKHPLVKSLASAEQKDGGDGVTIVEMTG